VIHADEERSRLANLRRAYARMEALISAAARLPKRRRPTKPSRAARERRLNSKRIHGAKKSGRRFPSQTDD
jgi:ribosome-associated protein